MRRSQYVTRSSVEFWDWTLDRQTGAQTWTDRMYAVMGLDRNAEQFLTSFFFVVNQPFWTDLDNAITKCLSSQWMINVTGSFINARGESVTLWAIGSERPTKENPGTLLCIRFCASIDGRDALAS